MRASQPPAERVDAPRPGTGPQHLLATVLGEYLDSAEAGLPSAAVVAVLAEFGVSESGARAALSRVVKRGLLTARQGARPPVYHLTTAALERHRARMHHFLSFGAAPRPWDGWWVTITFSLPQTHQSHRHTLRKQLADLRFALLYDHVWIRPGTDTDDVTRALDTILGVVPGARWSVLRSRFEHETGPHGPSAAYDLDGLSAAYQAFLDDHADLDAAVGRGELDAARALPARTALMDAWRVFADADPDLPAHLLPAPWPREEARALFLRVHTALGPLAQARMVEVTAPHWPDSASWITHYRAAPDVTDPPVRAQGRTDPHRS